MKHSIRYLALALLLALSVLLPSISHTSAQGAQPNTQSLDSTEQAPGIDSIPLTKDTVSTRVQKNEVPRIAISNSQIHVVWKSGGSIGHSQTGYNQRAEIGGSWPAQQILGGNSNGTYQTASVAVSPVDNSVHVVWVDTSQGGNGRVFYSRLQSNGQWTAAKVISSVGSFAHYPHMTVDTTGRIWVVWSAEDPPHENDNVYYRYSADNGATWLPSKEGKIDDQNAKRPWIAADKTGGVHVTWWRYEGGVWYAHWTGNSWVKEGIPSGGFNADPSITVDPNNNIHIAWRRQRGFASWDIYYATKPVGSNSRAWEFRRLYEGGNIDKTVVIYADEAGTLHLAWYDTVRGNEIWYSQKPANGNWLSPPIDVSNDGIFNINADVVGRTDAGGTRAHIVFESWFGGDRDVRIQHVMAGTATPPATARPVIRGQSMPNGFKGTRNANLTVDFTGVGGGANQVRYHFNSPPTNADPWLPLATTMSMPAAVPTGDCKVMVLYTQVRNSTNGQMQATPASDSVVVDSGVQAIVPIRSETAPNLGDPDYIAAPRYVYNVTPEPSYCAGVASYQALNTTDTPHNGSDTSNHTVQIPTQGWTPEGSGFAERDVQASVRVTDSLGNTIIVPQTLHYDDDRPVVTGGSIAVANNSGHNAIATIDLSNVSVTDDSYGANPNVPDNKAYWGVWVLVSATDLGSPSLGDFASKGAVAVRVAHGQGRADVSLIGSGVPESGKTMKDPGQRFVYVRFIDGAGNVSNEMKTGQVTLNQGYTRPTYYLPLVDR